MTIVFIKSRLLKEELILVFLLCKDNIAPSSMTAKVYAKDVVLLNQIMYGNQFGVVEIMYSTVLQCMYQAKDSLMSSRSMKPVIVLPSLIVWICFDYGIIPMLFDSVAYCIELLSDTIV